MTRSVAMTAAIGISIACSNAALAFGTVSILGQDREHERITRAGLSDFGPKTLDEIAGKSGTFGAVGAPDNPARGLMSSVDAHCDGGDFLSPPAVPASPAYPQSQSAAQARLSACRAWMVKAMDAAVAAAAPLAKPGAINTSLGCVFDGSSGRAKCNVLEQLGLVLHASQDFYSHSNWTDQSAPGPASAANPPGLNKSGRAPWLDLRQTSSIPVGLISGCYDGFPESQHCEYGKLRRAKHEILNKDTGPIRNGIGGLGTTPRGGINQNFARAVAAAIDDTTDKWRIFQERVIATYGPSSGARIICVVRSDNRAACK